MPILFSAVACDKSIKSKYASCDGNFMEIIEEVISKLPPGNSKMTYFHGHYLFHYILEHSHLYFCITDKSCQRSRAFLFLNEIQRQYKSRGNEEFTNVLAAEMYRYSEDYNTIIIRKGEIDELNSIGVDSSETILGEKILYVDNPENLTYFSTISYIRKTPEKVEVSTDYSNEKIVDVSTKNSQHKNDDIPPCISTKKEVELSTKDFNDTTVEACAKNSNNRFYIYFAVIVTLVLILGLSFCTLEPMSCVIVTCIFVLYYVRSYTQNKT